MSTKKQPAKSSTGYTDEQLAKGKKARAEGASWQAVAAAAGAKSESYFSRVLRERFPELAAPAKPAPDAKPAAKKRTTRKVAAKK